MSKFECRRCGSCCRWAGYIYLTEDDVKRIARFLSLDEFEFVQRYAEIEHRPRLNLKAREDCSCIFLKGNDCTIHPVKPAQCADFPQRWRIKELEGLCDGQKELLQKDTGRP